MKPTKYEILSEIQKAVPICKPVNGVEYRIRCPICGDSQKDPTDSHCYIKCSNDPAEPLLYNCFLCNAHGVVNKYFLKKLGLNKHAQMLASSNRSHRIPLTTVSDVSMIIGTPVIASNQVAYIEKRLGKGFTYDDYDRFKIVWDFRGVLPYITSQKIRNTLPTGGDTITFLSDDKATLLVRNLTPADHDHAWRKIGIMRSNTRSFYTIKSQLDLFTSDPVVVNIAEGVFDILSVYKNFYDIKDSVFIAALGSDYIPAVEYAIGKGIIGSNVIVRIYVDEGIDVEELSKGLQQYKWLFRNITIFWNTASKDVGVSMDKIKLVHKRV